MSKSYEMDMCNGPLLGKMIRFAVPVMLSGILQLLFNAADIVVIGQFAGEESLASLSPTGSLSNLLINLFIGMSVGTNVLVAHDYGAGKTKDVEETVHTSVAISLIAGLFLVAVGVLLCRPLLEMMDTPENVIDRSEIYMRIYFAGMPVIMLFNFGSAILRAVGDTRRPLIFLSIAGVINVVLNMLFVIVFHMDVAGVALATVLSQVVSAGLVVRCLMKEEGACHLELKRIRIVKNKFRESENPCTCPKEFPVCICGKKPKGRVITRKPIVPSEEELEENTRSKSSKLRVFEREIQ